jgi:hypothetical protein
MPYDIRPFPVTTSPEVRLQTPSFTELIPILQLAIGPVILVSGVGLLLLTMTNRLALILQRTWELSREARQRPSDAHEKVRAQMLVLMKRARMMRKAIGLAVICVLLAATLVLMIFVTALLRLDDAWVLGLLFIGAMAALVASLWSFFQDVQQSLVTVKLELEEFVDVEKR